MKWSGLLLLSVLFTVLAAGQNESAQNQKAQTQKVQNQKATARPPASDPPVLKNKDLEDSVIVTLPGWSLVQTFHRTDGDAAKAPESEETALPAPVAVPAGNVEKASGPPSAPADAPVIPTTTAGAAATVAGWPTPAEPGSADAVAPPANPAAPPAATDTAPNPAASPANAPELPVAAGSVSAPALTGSASVPPAVPAPGSESVSSSESPVAETATEGHPPANVPAPAVAPHALKPLPPADYAADPGIFCQQRIGKWSEADARAVLGEATGHRPSVDENNVENGLIAAFNDPSGRFRQVELDFDAHGGKLRTVYLYPSNLTWTDCRHLWGGKVSASLANKGRRFYSYMDKKLDVLVDPSGKVISLDLY